MIAAMIAVAIVAGWIGGIGTAIGVAIAVRRDAASIVNPNRTAIENLTREARRAVAASRKLDTKKRAA